MSNVQCVLVNAYITLLSEFFKGDSAIRKVLLELLLSIQDLILAQPCLSDHLLNQLLSFLLWTFLLMILCLRYFLWFFVAFQRAFLLCLHPFTICEELTLSEVWPEKERCFPAFLV